MELEVSFNTHTTSKLNSFEFTYGLLSGNKVCERADARNLADISSVLCFVAPWSSLPVHNEENQDTEENLNFLREEGNKKIICS